MHTRRQFLGTSAWVLASGLVTQQRDSRLISREDLTYLRAVARRAIASATKPETAAHFGFPLVTPGGAYPSMWVRDFSMAAGCGLLSEETLQHHIRLIARCQNGPAERTFGERAAIPSHAIPDHVNYQGGSVFFPGTYSSGDDQGGEPYGALPPVDDHYEFIHLAAILKRRTGSTAFLNESIGGVRLLERLENAVGSPVIDSTTGLVTTDAARRAVGFGFCDGIYFTGKMLFPSLLRWRALGEMADLVAESDASKAKSWRREQLIISASLGPVFHRDGWLIAATEVGQQPDVWGTAFAVAIGAVPKPLERTLRNTLTDAVRRKTIIYQGAVRHVPTDHDFSPTSAWERTAGESKNRYQNGAYWHVPTGWLAQAIAPAAPAEAKSLVRDMVEHLRREEPKGAPWECLHPDGNYRQNPVYMASVTLPLEWLSD